MAVLVAMMNSTRHVILAIAHYQSRVKKEGSKNENKRKNRAIKRMFACFKFY